MTKHILYGDILKKTKSNNADDISLIQNNVEVKNTESEELSDIAGSLYPQLGQTNTVVETQSTVVDNRKHIIIK